MKKSKISQLAPSFRYLQTLALKWFNSNATLFSFPHDRLRKSKFNKNCNFVFCTSCHEINFKGAVSRQSIPVCLGFPITRPYLLWNLTLVKKLLVNDKITALWQTKYVFRASYLNLQTTEINFENCSA